MKINLAYAQALAHGEDMKNTLPNTNELETLRQWANAEMAYVRPEFYTADVFAKNCERTESKEVFWEMDSQDMGANRAGGGSISFFVEWACYLAATRGVDALHYALGVQDKLASQYAAKLPEIQAATHAIAVLTGGLSQMNRAAQALGRLGGKAGKGKAKARTPEQARAAAQARWKRTKTKTATRAR